MSTRLSLSFLLVGGVFTALSRAEPSESPAAPLVRRALEAERKSDSAGRAEWLQQALAADTNYAPARWSAGYLRVGEEWLSVEDATERAAREPRRQRYEQLRQSLPDAPASHVTLARFCRRERLAAHERSHWIQVLRHQPDHAEAQQRLGLRRYQGLLLSEDEIREYDALAARLERWRQRVAEWKPALLRKGTERDAVLAQLRAVQDAAVIPALESQLSEAREDLGLEVVAVVDALAEPASSRSLAVHAINSRFASVRSAAAERLGRREFSLYVPLLLGSLQSPIYALTATAPGRVRYEFHQEGPIDDLVLIRTLYGAGLAPAENSEELWRWFATRDMRQTQRRLEEVNATSVARNERIFGLLRNATGQRDRENDPVAWWNWWVEHNDLAYRRRTRKAHEVIAPVARGHSCFAAGTRVWTEVGPRPIESLRAGDLVLSLNVQSGELTYAPVLETTRGEDRSLQRLSIDGEDFLATPGHNFWVLGRGWRMARQLTEGSVLRSADGTQSVRQVGTGPEADVFNLVVGGTHAYFVGRARVLAHDITWPRYVPSAVPGSPGQEATE